MASVSCTVELDALDGRVVWQGRRGKIPLTNMRIALILYGKTYRLGCSVRYGA